MPTIHLEIDDAVLPLVEWDTLQPRLRAAVESALATSARPDAALSLVLTDDEEVRVLNWEYRGINAPTDVLSFAMHDETDEGVDEAGNVEAGNVEADISPPGESGNDSAQNRPGGPADDTADESAEDTADDTEPEVARPVFVIAEEAAADVGDYLGDIVIAVPYSQRQAQRFGNSLTGELCLLAVHGTLHLLGYDHATPQAEARMWAVQDEVLEALGETRLARRDFDD